MLIVLFYIFICLGWRMFRSNFIPQEEAGVRFICVEICLFQSCFVVPVGFENRSQNKNSHYMVI